MRSDYVNGATVGHSGNVDAFGYISSLSGFLAVGWIDLTWENPVDNPVGTIVGQSGTVSGELIVSLFSREDVRKLGYGFVMLMHTDRAQIGSLESIRIEVNGNNFELSRSDPCLESDVTEVVLRAKQFLKLAIPNSNSSRLRNLLDQPIYRGANSLPETSGHVHFEIDRVYLCPPRGLVLVGWFLDLLGEVARIRLRCKNFACQIDPTSWISLKRADVVQAFRGKYEILHDRVGFLVYVSEVYQRDESIYAEIEMRDGRIAFRPIEPGFLSGLQAITELLSQVELRGEDIVFGLGNVIGPAIAAMNTSRLQSRPEKTILQYGVPLNNPRATIIIPLYGRVDFLEYQIAFFSHGLADDHEIIYVLDDPERRAETEAIAKSCFAKFERPFALICLSHNVGYAPANNIGLSHARGDYICYLNSDVFPDNPDWLELLIATEESSESIGIVGAQLLYEDGTLQHRGCVFERDAEIGDLYLVHHPDKGRRVALPQSQAAAPAITGACMLMKRELALRLGGFDENYVIGDFEDADLCLRARELGQICVVDYRARLFHLERQSQGQSQPWRRNLTLYNAWRFQQRWNNHEL